MSQDNLELIQTEKDGKTLIISINRQEVYNALNRESKFAIIDSIKKANKDPEIKSIILTGSGKAFCTGQDLNDRAASDKDQKTDLGKTLEEEWIPLIQVMRGSSKLLIGAINGVCAGAGMPLALNCDLIISKPETKFVSGFCKLGLIPDVGSTYTLTRRLGYQRALHFFISNRPLYSEELRDCGLINELHDQPLEKAKEMAQAINKMAPKSLEMVKKNALYALENSFDHSLEREVHAQRFLGASEDFQEGIKAFFEKRDPEFKGK